MLCKLLTPLVTLVFLSALAGAHESYYLEFTRDKENYRADRARLDLCQWHQNRTPRKASLFFYDPKNGTQWVLTYPRLTQQKAEGQLRLMQPGKPALRESISVLLRQEDSTHLSLTFRGASTQGEIWLDLAWWNHGE